MAEAITEKFPDSDAHAILSAASDHFESIAYSDDRVIVGWALESCRELYRRMIDCGDYAGALKAISEMLKHSKRLEPSE